MITRFFKHLFTTRGALNRQFPADDLARITTAVAASEQRHSGQIVVALEAALSLEAIFDGATGKARAHAVFRDLSVWDTAQNNGILLYLLLADRDIEIVADRGIHEKVGQVTWEAICRDLEADLRAGKRAEAVIAAIERLADALAAHFSGPRGDNELPDRAVVL
jgi:uncharacterized membrane protein